MCSYQSYDLGRMFIKEIYPEAYEANVAQELHKHLWIYPFIGIFSIFALILEVKFLNFTKHKTHNQQLDDIFIEKKRGFKIRRRYKWGYSLFCAGLLFFGGFFIPTNIRYVEFENEYLLGISTPVFFALAGLIYFRDILKKQMSA